MHSIRGHGLAIVAAAAWCRPEKEAVFASGLKRPFGITLYPLGPNSQGVYIANSDSVVR